MIVSLAGLLETGGLAVVSDEAAATRLVEDINIMAGEGTAALFPSREWTFQEVQGVSREYEHARLAVLGRLHAGSLKIVVASAQAALQYTMPPEVLEKRIRTLEAGREYQMEELTRFLGVGGLHPLRPGGRRLPVLPAGRHPRLFPAPHARPLPR